MGDCDEMNSKLTYLLVVMNAIRIRIKIRRYCSVRSIIIYKKFQKRHIYSHFPDTSILLKNISLVLVLKVETATLRSLQPQPQCCSHSIAW